MTFKHVMTTILVLLIWSCTQDEPVVKVGQQEIKRGDYLEQLRKLYPENETFACVKDTVKMNVLNRLIENKLKICVGLDSNWDKNLDILRALRLIETKELKQRYIAEHIWDKVISSEEIDNFIGHLAFQARATQIIVGYNTARYVARRSKTDALQLAYSILEKIKSGVRFSSLVKMYSNDQAVRINAGDTGYRPWDQFPAVVRDTIWSMAVGDISGPIVTPLGVYILRLDSWKKVPTYKAKKNEENILRAKKFFAQVANDTINKLTEIEVARLKERYDYSLNIININNLAARITAKINARNAQLESFTSEDRALPLAAWQGGQVSLNTLLDKYYKNFNSVIGKFAQMTFLRREVEKMALDEIYAQAARDAGITCEEQLQQERDKELIARFEQEMILNNIVITDENLEKYYQENLELFRIPDKIELWVIDVSSKKQADMIIKRAHGGQDFGELAFRFAKDESLKRRRGYLGFVTKETYATLSRLAFEHKETGSVVGPVEYRENLYVIKTGHFDKNHIEPFETAKSEVNRLYQRAQYQKIENERIRDLKQIYEVKLNQKVYHEI